MLQKILISAVLIVLALGIAEGNVGYACDPVTGQIFPVTCWYQPAAGDIGGIVTIAIDSGTFPARIMYPSWAAGQAVFEFVTTVQGILDYNRNSPSVPTRLVGDDNNNGVVEISEVTSYIQRWHDNTYPPVALGTVVTVINNWDATNRLAPKQEAKQKAIFTKALQG